MVIVVFRARLNDGVENEIARVGSRMFELASASPGFISYKDFVAEDGETVSIIEFEAMEHVDQWREHPEHKVAQMLGREKFFREFSIQVSELARSTTGGTSSPPLQDV